MKGRVVFDVAETANPHPERTHHMQRAQVNGAEPASIAAALATYFDRHALVRA